MNKKNLMIRLLTAMLVAAFVFTGCGGKTPATETTATTETTGVTESVSMVETTDPTSETVVLGMDEEAAATEETQDYENMPTVPAPEEPAMQDTTEYERYTAMSGEEQQAFVDSFGSMEAFFEWYNTAKEEYEASKKDVEISGDEIIDANG